jgi:hypothetical protein
MYSDRPMNSGAISYSPIPTPTTFLSKDSPLKLNPSNLRGTRPVCQVVWEGRRREASPYPDRWHFAPIVA